MVQETKVSKMKQKAPSATALRVADLPHNKPTAFSLRPDTSRLKELADELGLIKLRKLSFEGQVTAAGANDWTLFGKLGATVTQTCAVTLADVTTRLEEDVRRVYLRGFQEIDASECEMPEDDEVEQLTDWIDPEAVMLEALILALPLYPRAPDAELGEVVVTEPGITPLRDEDAKPFAGLAHLKNRLSNGEPPDKD